MKGFLALEDGFLKIFSTALNIRILKDAKSCSVSLKYNTPKKQQFFLFISVVFFRKGIEQRWKVKGEERWWASNMATMYFHGMKSLRTTVGSHLMKSRELIEALWFIIQIYNFTSVTLSDKETSKMDVAYVWGIEHS